MGSLRRRLEDLESKKSGARASPEGRPCWRTPEEEAEREQQFRRLYMQIGGEWPPEPKSREEAFEELFAMIENHRAETDRKEQQR
jgi:hypothetical protein